MGINLSMRSRSTSFDKEGMLTDLQKGAVNRSKSKSKGDKDDEHSVDVPVASHQGSGNLVAEGTQAPPPTPMASPLMSPAGGVLAGGFVLDGGVGECGGGVIVDDDKVVEYEEAASVKRQTKHSLDSNQKKITGYQRKNEHYQQLGAPANTILGDTLPAAAAAIQSSNTKKTRESQPNHAR